MNVSIHLRLIFIIYWTMHSCLWNRCYAFLGKEECWGELLAAGFHRKREILLMTTCLLTDFVLTALYVVSQVLNL